jgi:membrane protein implicated in regulation of membrane protease activity
MKKLLALLLLLPQPAFAHYGDHSALGLLGLAAHLFEADHILFAGITVMTGIIAYRWGRSAERRAARQQEQRHDPR